MNGERRDEYAIRVRLAAEDGEFLRVRARRGGEAARRAQSRPSARRPARPLAGEFADEGHRAPIDREPASAARAPSGTSAAASLIVTTLLARIGRASGARGVERGGHRYGARRGGVKTAGWRTDAPNAYRDAKIVGRCTPPPRCRDIDNPAAIV